MRPYFIRKFRILRTISFIFCFCLFGLTKISGQVIISQYYEGNATNKWIELSNLGNSPVTPQNTTLKLRIWSQGGSTGVIAFTGAISTFTINVSIPAQGSILLGNTGNDIEVPYLNSSSAHQNNNAVINFNGNDGLALLDGNDNVIDRFGTGINAANVSYQRNLNVSAPNPNFQLNEWTMLSLNAVQTALSTSAAYLGVHQVTCPAPDQASNLQLTQPLTNTIQGTFNPSNNADDYLVVRTTQAPLNALPQNGAQYSVGQLIGNGTVVYQGPNTFFSSLVQPATNYYFTIFSIRNNSCIGGPTYQTISPLTGSKLSLPNCQVPLFQPNNLTFNSVGSSQMQLSFHKSIDADAYLVVRYNNTTIYLPTDGVTYKRGHQIGPATVAYFGSDTSFLDWGVDGNTPYFYRIYSVRLNSCIGGPVYRKSAPLRGMKTTEPTTLQWYYGNLHSHSALSDGTGPATAVFNYSEASLCMDFLGISDHNHAATGMSLGNWELGKSEADSFARHDFLSMYGMEWGTISSGGHVVIYGSDSLLGWEPGYYQSYIPQSQYQGSGGLFQYLSQSTVPVYAALAHPDNSDFNNLQSAYDLTTDQAVFACAVENGPSTSTDTMYADYPSSMAYLSYFRNLLALGYHVAPSIDHDNHNLTHGRTAFSRTAVLSASLAEHHFMEALRSRRIIATQDCGAVIDFKINGAVLGSIFNHPGPPQIIVTASTSVPISQMRIQSGIPGNGLVANVLTSTAGSTLSFTHTGLADGDSRYYYVDITLTDGRRIITAPIWYTRMDDLISTTGTTVIQEFKTLIDSNGQLDTRWTVREEREGDFYKIDFSQNGIDYANEVHFRIEKNTDQLKFHQTKNVSGSNFKYARLRLQDAFGTTKEERILSFFKNKEKECSLFPNPVVNELDILQPEDFFIERFELVNSQGQTIFRKESLKSQGQKIKIFLPNSISPGIYRMQIQTKNGLEIHPLLKQG
jgi:hypothetical protein